MNSIHERAWLNNGRSMPWLGLGVWRMADGGEVESAVRYALDIGYRSIDTAAAYGNERGVGQAIRRSGVAREDVFLTTKVWNDDQRARRTRQAFDESLKRLGVDYVDLYLIHWPVKDRYQETWQDLEAIYAGGRARAIGVSNFLAHHLQELLRDVQIVPAVNQVEFHPFLVQPALLEFCRSHGIQVEAWSPLAQGEIVNEPVVQGLASKYGKTPAQVVLRWDVQHRVVTIPKSTHADRIAENAQVFDFELAPEDVQALDALDVGRRVGPDPNSFAF